MRTCHDFRAAEGSEQTDAFDPKRNFALRAAMKAARAALVPENYIARVVQFAKQGYTSIDFKTYDSDWDSDAYLTVSGQNSNNRSEEHTSELQSLMRISYAVFCLKKKKRIKQEDKTMTY